MIREELFDSLICSMSTEQLQRAQERWAFMSELIPISDEGKAVQIAHIRRLAELSRHDGTARSLVERWAAVVVRRYPDKVETFRAYYLDGETQPTARQIGRQRYISLRTVHRHIGAVLDAMRVPAIGVAAIFDNVTKRET